MFFEVLLEWLLWDRWERDVNLESDPFKEDSDPEYTAREMRGEFTDAHWESADAEWHRQNDGRWNNYAPDELEDNGPLLREENGYYDFWPNTEFDEECELAEDND